MTGRHADLLPFDGCRNREPATGFRCGHSPVSHDLPSGGCAFCRCPQYRGDYRRAFLVLGAALLFIAAVVFLVNTGVIQ